jgi:hypothetical protein
MCSAVKPFAMSPNVVFERRLQVDNGLFVFLSATENENYWCKLTERHLSLFLQGFEAVDPGMLYPACRHYFSRVTLVGLLLRVGYGYFLVTSFIVIFIVCVFFIRLYPGYAFYRDLYPFSCARLLFWMETGIDICYPRDRQADLYKEKLFYLVQDLLEIRQLQWNLENYFRELC